MGINIKENDIVVISIPFDDNSSYIKGSALGYDAILKFANSGSSNWSTEAGIDLSKRENIKFLGKIKLKEFFGIEKEILKILDKRAKIISVGGDHSITFPILKAFSSYFGEIDILHFDAHPDLYEIYDNNPYSHACTFSRVMEEKLARKLHSVGIRASTPNQNLQAEKFGVETITMENLESIFRFEFKNPLYISIDIDSLDPAFAPGVSHPEPGGLTSRELIDMIKKIKVSSLIGADIVEFNPLKDINDITSAVSFKILKELLGKFLSVENNLK